MAKQKKSGRDPRSGPEVPAHRLIYSTPWKTSDRGTPPNMQFLMHSWVRHARCLIQSWWKHAQLWPGLVRMSVCVLSRELRLSIARAGGVQSIAESCTPSNVNLKTPAHTRGTMPCSRKSDALRSCSSGCPPPRHTADHGNPKHDSRLLARSGFSRDWWQ